MSMRVWLQLGIWRSGVQASPVALFPYTGNLTFLCLSSPGGINGTGDILLGGGGGVTMQWTNIPSGEE